MKIKLHHIIRYIVSCGITAMDLLLYEFFFMLKYLLYIMMGLWSNGYFVTRAPCLNEGHDYERYSQRGHLRSDLVGLLIMDGSVHIKGTDFVSQVLQDNVNLAGNGLKSWVDHMMLSYGMIIVLQHILYLYCIHDDIVKW
jgi:hypothetical protein